MQKLGNPKHKEGIQSCIKCEPFLPSVRCLSMQLIAEMNINRKIFWQILTEDFRMRKKDAFKIREFLALKSVTKMAIVYYSTCSTPVAAMNVGCF